MEERRRSSPATDSPLLPLHNAPGQHVQSSAQADLPILVSPTRQNERVRSFDVPQGADLGESFDEKPDVLVSPTRQSAMGEPKTASIEEEQRALNWIVPVQNGMPVEKRRTVGERLQSTLDVATLEHKKYEEKAKRAGMAINGAMFAQIISNALITGLSAATSNRHAQIGVSALGALGTIISAFLVRVRGTREPERSVTHAQNLEKFIRELEAFILDEGYSRDRKWDPEVKRFRVEFDQLQTAVHQSENGQPMSGTGTGSTPAAPAAPAGPASPIPAAR